jgi:retinol dehydrogenase-12
MNGQVCVVTGATSGIGLETARQLAVRGARVVMTGRSEERGEAALANIRAGCPEADLDLVLLDLADLSNVRHAGRHLRDKYGSISVLVNNAGVYEASRTQTVDGFEATFAVNHLGPFLFTNLLLPSLLDCPTTRVVNVSSEAHRASEGLDYSDLQWTRRRYSALRSYADSKLANLLFTRSLSKRFDPERLVAHAVHPGAVATGLFRGDQPLWMRMGVGVAKHFMKSPEQGAETSVHVATDVSVGAMTGGYFANRRIKTPTRVARDDLEAGRLWEISAQLVHIDA